MNLNPARCWAAVVLIFCGWGIAVNVADGQSLRVTSRTSASETTESIVCAIVGDVRFPGSYRFSKAAPTRNELVNLAGDVSKEATGINIRVFGSGQTSISNSDRQGTWQNDQRLLSGDVVVVSSAQSRLAALDHTIHHGRLPATRSKRKQHIVLAGLSKEPVVLPIHKRGAILADLCAHLNQPRHLSSNVRIFRGNGISRNREVINGSLKLKDGMLLVFRSQAIEEQNLPQLPRPYSASERWTYLAELKKQEEVSLAKLLKTSERNSLDRRGTLSTQPGVAGDTADFRNSLSSKVSQAANNRPFPISTSTVKSTENQSGWKNSSLMLSGAAIASFGAFWLFMAHRQRSQKIQSRLSGRIKVFVKRGELTEKTLRADEASEELEGPNYLREAPVSQPIAMQVSEPMQQQAETFMKVTKTSERPKSDPPNANSLMHRVLQQLQDKPE